MDADIKKLSKNSNSVLFLETNLTKQLVKKIKKSVTLVDKNFVKKWNKDLNLFMRKENIINEKDEESEILKNLPNKNIPEVEQKFSINTTLLQADRPFISFHADVADLNFTKPSAADPKYALIIVDLFSSFLFVYPMKNKSLLSKKMNDFYKKLSEYDKYKEDLLPIKIQTDQEFEQNEIKDLNEQYNVNMFSTKINRGHAFAAEQKIKMIKQKFTSLLLNKEFSKQNKSKTLLDIVKNLNQIPNKYKIPPVDLIRMWIEGANISKLNHERLKTIQRNNAVRDRMEFKTESRKKFVLRELNIGDVVLVQSYRIKKKDDPGKLTKPTTRKKDVFDRKNLFKVRTKNLIKTNNKGISFHTYTLERFSTGEIINENFKRKELYAINKNLVLNKNRYE